MAERRDLADLSAPSVSDFVASPKDEAAPVFFNPLRVPFNALKSMVLGLPEQARNLIEGAGAARQGEPIDIAPFLGGAMMTMGGGRVGSLGTGPSGFRGLTPAEEAQLRSELRQIINEAGGAGRQPSAPQPFDPEVLGLQTGRAEAPFVKQAPERLGTKFTLEPNTPDALNLMPDRVNRFNILNENGDKVGFIHASRSPWDPKEVNIDMMGAGGGGSESIYKNLAGSIGPAGVRDVFRQFRGMFPDVESVMATRVTGARYGPASSSRIGETPREEVSMKLSRFAVPLGAGAGGLADLVSGRAEAGDSEDLARAKDTLRWIEAHPVAKAWLQQQQRARFGLEPSYTDQTTMKQFNKDPRYYIPPVTAYGPPPQLYRDFPVEPQPNWVRE